MVLMNVGAIPFVVCFSCGVLQQMLTIAFRGIFYRALYKKDL